MVVIFVTHIFVSVFVLTIKILLMFRCVRHFDINSHIFAVSVDIMTQINLLLL